MSPFYNLGKIKPLAYLEFNQNFDQGNYILRAKAQVGKVEMHFY